LISSRIVHPNTPLQLAPGILRSPESDGTLAPKDNQ
jgi:hypothetical protein